MSLLFIAINATVFIPLVENMPIYSFMYICFCQFHSFAQSASTPPQLPAYAHLFHYGSGFLHIGKS